MGASLKHGTATMIDHTPVAAVEAGAAVELATGIFGLAHSDIPAGELGAVSWPNGLAVYEIDKSDDQDVFAVGGLVGLTADATANGTTAEAAGSGDGDYGRCVKASGAGVTTVLVINSASV